MDTLRRVNSLGSLILILAVVTLSMGFTAQKAYSEEVRPYVIGVIDILEVIREVEPLKNAWEEFVAADEDYSNRAYFMNQYYQQVAQEYTFEMDTIDVKDPDYNEKTKVIEDKYNKILETAQDELKLEEYESDFMHKVTVWQEMYEQMKKVLAEVAKQNGVDIVLNKLDRPDAPIFQTVFYGGKDITKPLIAALKEKYNIK
jgi:membrane-bound lytic murein transglycosylase B